MAYMRDKVIRVERKCQARLDEKGRFLPCEETTACIDCITNGRKYLIVATELSRSKRTKRQ